MVIRLTILFTIVVRTIIQNIELMICDIWDQNHYANQLDVGIKA